jgi:N-acyl-L-homoserine lactone synthetase
MLHVLRVAQHPAPDHVMQAMFAARKRVFVDLLKWDVPVIDDRFEVDQFDDQHAHYLVLAEPDGRHLGSARLLPTMRPHILDSLYSELCENDPPRAGDIYEITRFCLDRGLNASERRAVRDTLVTALVDHALACGITSYTAIAEVGWLQQILAFGWRCRPLGLPTAIAGQTLGAIQIHITVDTPHLLARAGITALPEHCREEPRAAA